MEKKLWWWYISVRDQKALWRKGFGWAARVVVQLNNNFRSISSSRLTQYRNLRGHDVRECVSVILLIILWMSNRYQQITYIHTRTHSQICAYLYHHRTARTKRKRQPVKATISLAATSAVWVKPDRMSFIYCEFWTEANLIIFIKVKLRIKPQ